MLSAEILGELREDHAEAGKNISNTTDMFLVFRMSPSLARLITIDYVYQLSSLYMLNISCRGGN